MIDQIIGHKRGWRHPAAIQIPKSGMEHIMKREQWKKAIKAVVVAGGLMLVSAAAEAQTLGIGTNVGVNLGDVRIAHGSALQVGPNGVSGGVADGVRVGGQTVTTGVQGAVTAPVSIAKKVFGF
jgi:hypothetical protein